MMRTTNGRSTKFAKNVLTGMALLAGITLIPASASAMERPPGYYGTYCSHNVPPNPIYYETTCFTWDGKGRLHQVTIFRHFLTFSWRKL